MARMLKVPLGVDNPASDRWVYLNADLIASIQPVLGYEHGSEVHTADGDIWHVRIAPATLANATRNGPTDLTKAENVEFQTDEESP